MSGSDRADEDGEDGAVSEDSGERRRPRRGASDGADSSDRSQPVTAAGRRRREGAVAGAGKGTATPTRQQQEATPQGSLFARLQRFLREVVAELRKVHWPTRRQIVVYTGVVLAFVTFMVALVYGLDALFSQAVFALFG
jgi:preprotein translocase subunit SecE